MAEEHHFIQKKGRAFPLQYKTQMIQLNMYKSGLHGLEWKTRDPYSLVSANVLVSRCLSPPLGVFLPRFHVGPGPSARASASLSAGGRWRTKTLAPLLPTRTHRKGTPRHDTGGAPTAAPCTWASMMTARTEINRLELDFNCFYICFASLPSLWSACCRPGIRVWNQLLMLKVNATILA